MKKFFGITPSGEEAFLYTITDGFITAVISDFGATLVRLLVPNEEGRTDDVILGFDEPAGYASSTAFLGAIVGRNANRIGGARVTISGEEFPLPANENGNNLHSGPDHFHLRLWKVAKHTENAICLTLHSPHGDQGFPGNADIRVTYTADCGGLKVSYTAVSDRDTVFNFTNHAYFNLAGHQHPEKAMEQTLILPGRFFTPDDAQNIPTGEERPVSGTPMDFRAPKAIGRDIDEDYDALNLQGGYDHNWEVFCNPCAILSHSESKRTMAVYTDCPGVQFYAGNYLDESSGKDGIAYPKRSGVCLETQFFPDATHKGHWRQPVTKAGEVYKSETVFKFR